MYCETFYKPWKSAVSIYCVCINEIIMDHIWDTLHPILIDLNSPAVCARVPTAPLSHSLTS